MNDADAKTVIRESVDLGNKMLRALYAHSTPDVAIVSLMSVVAVVLCNVTLEDGVTQDQMFDQWVLGLREEFDDKLKEMKAVTNPKH